MGSRANTFLDESISPVIDPLGEETRELLGDDPLSLCLHCSTGNSDFRIGFKCMTVVVSTTLPLNDAVVISIVSEEATLLVYTDR